MTADEAMQVALRRDVKAILGDRVESVAVILRDHDYLLGVGIKTSRGWRHAVAIDDWRALPPERLAEIASVKLSAWLDAIDTAPTAPTWHRPAV